MTDAGPIETELARAPAEAGGRDLIVGLDPTSVVVRMQGTGADALYVAMTPEQALRIGAAFIRGALRLKPHLSMQDIETIGRDRKPKAVDGSEGAGT